jgi:hypothetical protein
MGTAGRLAAGGFGWDVHAPTAIRAIKGSTLVERTGIARIVCQRPRISNQIGPHLPMMRTDHHAQKRIEETAVA